MTMLTGFALACWRIESPMLVRALGAVILTNLVGIVAAVFVTDVLGLPNDGSLKRERRDDAG